MQDFVFSSKNVYSFRKSARNLEDQKMYCRLRGISFLNLKKKKKIQKRVFFFLNVHI